GEEVLKMSTEEIVQRTRLLDSEIKIMKSEVLRVTHELQAMKDKIKENSEKIKVNKTLPYLVSNVIELLDVDPNDQEEDGANVDLDSQRKGKCAVIKTSTRQTYFLPVIGLVDAEKLKPGDLVGVNKDSYLILETLPTEYDSRVKAMEVDERPTEQYSDVGGLDKQIQELVEAIVLPMNHKEKFENLGIQPPKGVLMYGPPGTGKTLLARACAAQTKATFLKLAGPQLVQMFIGDGAKLVRDAFALAKEKAPSIIFIDELDAIGTKRFDSEKAGDREVQRTMLELLNQLDGFQPNTLVKVIAATNRVDILDPALLRSGRLDRKIEFPMPNEEARARIMQIHSRKMNVSLECLTVCVSLSLCLTVLCLNVAVCLVLSLSLCLTVSVSHCLCVSLSLCLKAQVRTTKHNWTKSNLTVHRQIWLDLLRLTAPPSPSPSLNHPSIPR
uniref:Proteasome 26S subunit, ATPase 3 n=1 Tax=Callorhinchus milii TaxID=7868 RepID=A0A4W3HW55_CALMI